MLTELDPKPGLRDGRDRHDAVGHHVHDVAPDDIKGTHLDNNPEVQAAWAGHVGRRRARPSTSSTSSACAPTSIQPYFVPGHIHQWEIIERLIRAGVYMGPLNMAIAGYGGGTLGRNPFDWMDFLRRVPQGAVCTFWSQHARADLDLRHGDRARPARPRRQRGQPLGRRQEAQDHRRSRSRARCASARSSAARSPPPRRPASIMKIGTWYDSVEETLQQPRPAAEPPRRQEGLPGLDDRRQASQRPDRAATRIRWPTAWSRRTRPRRTWRRRASSSAEAARWPRGPGVTMKQASWGAPWARTVPDRPARQSPRWPRPRLP